MNRVGESVRFRVAEACVGREVFDAQARPLRTV